MKDFRIIYDGTDPVSLPDGTDLGVIGEHNAVKLVISLPASMVAGMTYHVVTVGGVDSAFIVDTQPNVDGAFRVENVIYMPLVAAFTHNRIADVTVTAYKQTGDVVQVVDKTPTAYGLTFSEGQPQEIVGGMVAEVKALENEVDAIRDDLPTAAEVESWNKVAREAYTEEKNPVLGKFSETEDGKLLFDGEEIGSGSGIEVVDTPSDLDAAEDGAVSFAFFDDLDKHLDYPKQTSGEEVSVDISGKMVRIYSPEFNEQAIDAAITAADISASGTLHLELPDNEDGDIVFGILPVVSDIDTNEYTAAGITLDDAIVAATYTKKYAVSALISHTLVNPDKIVEVDANHVKIPFLGVFTFEALTDEDSNSYSEGWNLFLATVDKETYSDISATEFVGSVNINDYLIFSTDNDNTLTLDGLSASELFKGVVDLVDVAREKGLYIHKNGYWQNSKDIQDYTPLVLKSYDNLFIRDLVRDDGIQDVPVYNTGETGAICKMLDASENSVSLEETRQASGDPVRFIKVYLEGTYYVWMPVELVTQISTTPAGWSSGGQTVEAPSLAGFTPVKIEVGETTYEDLANIPRDVQLALGSLSQCINESADAMGHINVPDDAVTRYAGRIEPNRKYYFKTGNDVSFDLPDVPVSKEDAQFVIYLKCRESDVDISFPADTLISGEIDSSQGLHKIIGCWLRDQKCWAVGGLTYEEASA